MQTFAWEYKTKIVRDGRSQRYLNYEKQIKTVKKEKEFACLASCASSFGFLINVRLQVGLKRKPPEDKRMNTVIDWGTI